MQVQVAARKSRDVLHQILLKIVVLLISRKARNSMGVRSGKASITKRDTGVRGKHSKPF
jgi:hypothetical protein